MNKIREGVVGRFFLLFLLLFFPLFPTGCSKEEKKPEQTTPTVKESPTSSGTKEGEVEVKPKQLTLTYSVEGKGSLEGNSSQVVNPGESGTSITAVPAAGHHFIQWSDGSTVNPRTDANVNADLAVSAHFGTNQYNLLYNAGEHGSLTGPALQRVNHGGSGKPVTAVPEKGYHFIAWSDSSTANPRTDANVTADLAATAGFAINQYTLTYSAEGNGYIEGAASQSVTHGGAGSTVTAKAAAGYHFAGWSDGVDTPDRTDTNVSGDISVSATFELNYYTVGGKVSGLAEGNGVVLKNGEEELTVSSNGDFAFPSALTDGRPFSVTVITQPTSPNQTCTVTGGAGTIAAANVTGVRVECRFNVYTVGGTISGLPEGGEVVLQNNKGDDLVVRANGKFVFAMPQNDGSGYDVSVHSQKLKPKWSCSVEQGKGALTGSNVTGIDVACFPVAELLAVPGLGRIDLSWNGQDFPGASFNLCRAREDIDKVGFAKCKALVGGVSEMRAKSPHSNTRLASDVPYWFQLEVQHPGGRRTYSEVVSETPFGSLNDTGIDWCADTKNRNRDGTRGDKTVGCESVAATHPGQDGHLGRDATARGRKLTKAGSGKAGFDFTKVCGSGKLAGEGDCPPNPTLGSGPTNWVCTRDNVTGLTWEVKSTSGLRSRDNLYTWYNPDTATNGGSPGVPEGGRCTGSKCNTLAYVQAVNGQGLCGAGDWRLPTRQELVSIVDNGQFKPAIDQGFFPNSSSGYFWSSSPYVDQAESAWQVYFQYGEVLTQKKGEAALVRLVRREK